MTFKNLYLNVEVKYSPKAHIVTNVQNLKLQMRMKNLKKI